MFVALYSKLGWKMPTWLVIAAVVIGAFAGNFLWEIFFKKSK